jgi:hypothetical protein
MTNNDNNGQAKLGEIESKENNNVEKPHTEGVDSFSSALFENPEEEFGSDSDSGPLKRN